MAGIAGNWWTQLEIAENGWKWLKNCWKWQEMAGNGWKWPEIAWKGFKWLEMAGNGRKWLEWLEMAVDGLIWLDIAGIGLKWLEMTGKWILGTWYIYALHYLLCCCNCNPTRVLSVPSALSDLPLLGGYQYNNSCKKYLFTASLHWPATVTCLVSESDRNRGPSPETWHWGGFFCRLSLSY